MFKGNGTKKDASATSGTDVDVRSDKEEHQNEETTVLSGKSAEDPDCEISASCSL